MKLFNHNRTIIHTVAIAPPLCLNDCLMCLVCGLAVQVGA